MLTPVFKESPECEPLFCYPKFHPLRGSSTKAGVSFFLCTNVGGEVVLCCFNLQSWVKVGTPSHSLETALHCIDALHTQPFPAPKLCFLRASLPLEMHN